jgi:hypothetical protein
MTLLWMINASLECGQHIADMEDERPPRFKFVNRAAIHKNKIRVDAEYHGDNEAERELLEFNSMPVPVFKIVDPTFGFDYFNGGLPCASLRLREVFNLTDDVIRYRDVDLDGSPPGLRALRYQVYHVAAYADPVDWTKTAGQALELPRPDGSTRKIWCLAPPDPAGPPQRVYWRDDFLPPAPLFRALGTPWTLAIEALADRVMRAGITDLAFYDITSDLAQTEIVMRQL